MYPTDLTEPQWQFIQKTLELVNRKRKHSLRSIWNAINYLVKSGCQWRMLPSNFPKWQLVYYYYSKWSYLEQFDLLLSKLTERVRINKGQNAQPSLGIIDSQSVRWGNNRSLNGFDGNKKVKGIKRHVVVDRNGFLLAVMVTVANVHDSKAVLLLMRTLKYFLCPIKIILDNDKCSGKLLNKLKIDLDILFKS